MGMDTHFETAYYKSQLAAGQLIPDEGRVFLSAADHDKKWALDVGRELTDLGYHVIATEGTAARLAEAGVEAEVVHKLASGESPTIIDFMRDGNVHMVINTPSGPVSRRDEVKIRSEAILRSIPIITTESGARASLQAQRHVREHGWDVKALQDYGV